MPSDSDEPNDPSSLFDLGSSDEGSDEPTRVQELKRALFDLAYLVVNADGTEHISERMLIQKLERRMEREGSVDVEARSDELHPVLEEGPAAIRERVKALADEVAERSGERTAAVGDRYLDLLKGLIVADADVDAQETELFRMLCDRWNVEKTLPGM